MQVFNYGGMAANAMDSLGEGLNQMRARQEQERAMQQQQDSLKQAAQLFSSGTPDEIAQFSIQNPQAGELLSRQIAFKNDATKQNMIDSMRQIMLDPSSTESVLTNRIKTIQEQGGDPTQTMAELEQFRANPDGYEQKVERAFAMLDPQGYGAYKSTLPKQAAPMSEYQRASLGLQRDKMNFDREMKMLDVESKRAERALKQADTEVKRQKAQADLDAANAKREQAKQQDQSKINEGIYTANQNKQVINDLLNNDTYIDDLTGWMGRTPAITDAAVEANAYLDNIKNSMTIDNLGVMSGPLTDKDIQIIASASSRLREGMSEPALKKELRTISKAYDRVIKNYEKEANRKGYQLESSQQDQLGGDTVVFSSDKYGDVTEADIQATMSKHNMTREQVMSRLGK
jgi:hypothetical protein